MLTVSTQRLFTEVSMNDNTLLTEQKDGVALITLNRPEVMNSFNFALLHALQAKITDIRFDTGIRVVIITGSGDRAFCSGADLKERATLSPIQGEGIHLYDSQPVYGHRRAQQTGHRCGQRGGPGWRHRAGTGVGHPHRCG
jgi:enoyl-CoA hydratase/carnithine racemase